MIRDTACWVILFHIFCVVSWKTLERLVRNEPCLPKMG